MTLIDELAEALRKIIDNDWSDQNGCITFQIGNPGALPPKWAQKLVDAARAALARYAATKAADNGTTHFDQCWRDRTHHACAVAKIEEFQAKAEGAQAPVAWLYRAENGDIYEMLGGNDQAKFMRRYADDDRDWISLDEFNTMQPITTAPQSLPDSAQPDQVQAVAWRVGEPMYQTPPAAPSDGAMAQAVRELRDHGTPMFTSGPHGRGWLEALQWIEQRAREIAEGK